MPEGSKLTPKNIGTKFGFSEHDLDLSYMHMADDIKYTMTKLNQPWYVYQYVLTKKYDDYIYFLKNGGYNWQFAALALRIKILKQKYHNIMNIGNLTFEEVKSLEKTSLIGDPNLIVIWTKLLGYEKPDQ